MAIFNSYVKLPEGNQQHVSRRPASLGALTHQHENFGNTHTWNAAHHNMHDEVLQIFSYEIKFQLGFQTLQ